MLCLFCLLILFVPQALPENPLAPCPSTPNCVRESRLFDEAPEALRHRVRQALDKMGASDVEEGQGQDTEHLHAVFQIVIFKDDVDVTVAPYDGGAVVHIRSASRTGSYDFGVNRRRINRFFRIIEDAGGP